MTEASEHFGRRSAPPGAANAASSSGATCRGCGARLTGPFCAACGQAAKSRDSIADLLRELLQRLTRYDRRVWRSFPLLLLDPGRLSRDWNEGRRAGRLSPVHLTFFAVFVFCVAPMVVGWRDTGIDADGPAALIRDSMSGLRVQGLWFVLGLAPALTLILAAVCWKRDLALYNHAVVALHELAWIMLLATTIWIVILLWGPGVGIWLAFLVPLHLALHVVGAYRFSWIFGSMRAGVVLMLATFAWMMIAPFTQLAMPAHHGRPVQNTYFTRVPAAPADGA